MKNSLPPFINAETITLQPFAAPPVGSGIKAEVLNAAVMTVWGGINDAKMVNTQQ